MHDYLIRTIRAYDENLLRYEEATKGMISASELDAFVALLPDPRTFAATEALAPCRAQRR